MDAHPRSPLSHVLWTIHTLANLREGTSLALSAGARFLEGRA